MVWDDELVGKLEHAGSEHASMVARCPVQGCDFKVRDFVEKAMQGLDNHVAVGCLTFATAGLTYGDGRWHLRAITGSIS